MDSRRIDRPPGRIFERLRLSCSWRHRPDSIVRKGKELFGRSTLSSSCDSTTPRGNQPRGAQQLEVVRHGCALGDRFRTTPRVHSSAAQSPRGAPPYARDRQRMKRQTERQSGQARRTRFLHGRKRTRRVDQRPQQVGQSASASNTALRHLSNSDTHPKMRHFLRLDWLRRQPVAEFSGTLIRPIASPAEPDMQR